MRTVRIAIIAGALLLFSGTPAFSLDPEDPTKAMCFDDAGEMYNIAPSLLMAISKTESDFRTDVENVNKNGTVDICHMQINTFWKKHLQGNWKYLSNPCYCTKVGAWILRQCIDRYGYTWDAVACYNTGQSRQAKNKAKQKKAEQYVGKVQHALLSLKETN